MHKTDLSHDIPVFYVRRYEVSPVPVYVDTAHSFFFILLEGEISVTYDSISHRDLKAGDCILIMRQSCYRITIKKPAIGLRVLDSELFSQSCARIFGDLTKFIPKGFSYRFTVLSAPKAILDMHKSVARAITDGKACRQLFILWSETLTLMMHSYFTAEEIACFLSPIIASDYDFRQMVVKNSLSAKDLPQLASLCGMSLSTFKRHFKHTFHSPAHTWIAARKAHFIYSEIINTRKTFIEIAKQFGISSSAYLTAFCKQHFNMTPQEIRRSSIRHPIVTDTID